MPLEEVLASWQEPAASVEVPAESWITDRFTLTGGRGRRPSRAPSGWAGLTSGAVSWSGLPRPSTSTSSARASRPSPPRRRGRRANTGWFSSTSNARPIRSRPYRVRRRPRDDRAFERIIRRCRRCREARRDEGRQPTVEAPRVILENKSPFYLQANTSRDQVYLKSVRNHAGTMRTSAGSLVLSLRQAARKPPRIRSVPDAPALRLAYRRPDRAAPPIPRTPRSTYLSPPSISLPQFIARASRSAASPLERPGSATALLPRGDRAGEGPRDRSTLHP